MNEVSIKLEQESDWCITRLKRVGDNIELLLVNDELDIRRDINYTGSDFGNVFVTKSWDMLPGLSQSTIVNLSLILNSLVDNPDKQNLIVIDRTTSNDSKSICSLHKNGMDIRNGSCHIIVTSKQPNRAEYRYLATITRQEDDSPMAEFAKRIGMGSKEDVKHDISLMGSITTYNKYTLLTSETLHTLVGHHFLSLGEVTDLEKDNITAMIIREIDRYFSIYHLYHQIRSSIKS